MSAPAGLSAGSNPTLSLSLWNKVHRYRCLLRKYWWVVVFTLSFALCVTAYFQMNKPPTFASTAKLSINSENRLAVVGDQSAGTGQDPEAMLGTVKQFIETSSDVHRNAADILAAKFPDMRSSPVTLEYAPKNTILTITATGTDPRYTERYLQATIEGYLAYRKQQRGQNDDPFFKAMREQIATLDETLRRDNEALIQFLGEHQGHAFESEEKTNDSLNALRQQRDVLQTDLDRLKLMTPEQGIDHGSASPGTRSNAGGNSNGNGGAVSPTTQIALDLDNTQENYRHALSQIADLKAQLDIFTADMRETHPKVIALRAAVKTQQRQVDDALEYARQRIESQRTFTASRLVDLDAKIKAAEPEALQDRVQWVKYNQLLETKKRDQETQERLTSSLTQANLHTSTTPETIFVMEKASEALPILAPWMKAVVMAGILGLAVGLGILFLIDRMDDRMGSIGDFQTHFAEHVLGQIPARHAARTDRTAQARRPAPPARRVLPQPALHAALHADGRRAAQDAAHHQRDPQRGQVHLVVQSRARHGVRRA